MIATFFFYIFVWMIITLALKNKEEKKKIPQEKKNTGDERVNSSDSLGIGFRV